MTIPGVSSQGLRLVTMLAMLVVIMADKSGIANRGSVLAGYISCYRIKSISEIVGENKNSPHFSYCLIGHHYYFTHGIAL